jgi:hypothetical protein
MLGYSPHIHARDLYEIPFEPANIGLAMRSVD